MKVTEWMWFCLRLDLLALGTRSRGYAKVFDYSKKPRLKCEVVSEMAAKFIAENMSREEQAHYYAEWRLSELDQVIEALEDTPKLKKELRDSLGKFELAILIDGGGAPSLLCAVHGRGVRWARRGPGVQ